MDLFKKPLAAKMKKKRLRSEKVKQAKEDKEIMALMNDKNDNVKPPPHLRGKQIGLWYRNKKLEEKGMTGEKATKKTKVKEKVRKRKSNDMAHYELMLSDDIKERIRMYLASVEDIPPPSLAAQVRMMKGGSFNNLSVQYSFEKYNEMIDRKPKKNKRNATNNNEAIDYWVYGEDDEFDTFSTENMPECPRRLAAVDKYKHLEETTFKKRFLHAITGSIESNLEKGLHKFELTPNPQLNHELKQSFFIQKQTVSYCKYMALRKKLPTNEMHDEILKLIDDHQVVLISGETGCGKTTQVAQFILDRAIEAGNGSTCSILCTQPRRISAISVAERVAKERNEFVGKDSVGYHVRLDRSVGRTRGSIIFCTTGMLIQYLQSDPALTRYSHIILDEIHERDVLIDFTLTVIKDIIDKRADLKIILMSATLNAQKFSLYFNDCPMIMIPGYTHPVTVHYLEDILTQVKFPAKNFKKAKKGDRNEDFSLFVQRYIKEITDNGTYSKSVIEAISNPESENINPDLIIALIRHIDQNEGNGAILIFLPGWDDINTLNKTIVKSDLFPPDKYWILLLHSMLPTAEQQRVFENPPKGVRKIIISTNIAETSITIDDVVFVIDSGKAKVRNFDTTANISTLTPEWVSKANAKQRRGRAGRIQPGVCYRLYTRGREHSMLDYPIPDILRTRLEELILNVKILQLGDTVPFLRKVMDPPDEVAVQLSLELLMKLNALDENENLTPLGYHLAHLAMEPQIGKMLIMGTIMSCLNPMLDIAAAMSHKDQFVYPMGREAEVNAKKLTLDNERRSDHLLFVEVMKQWEQSEKRGNGRTYCDENFLLRNNLFKIRDLKSQFARYLYEIGFILTKDYKSKILNMNSDNVAILKTVICSGLYPNVAVIKSKKKRKRNKVDLCKIFTSEDGPVSLISKSINKIHMKAGTDCCPTFLLYHGKMKSTNVNLYDTTAINAIPMLLFGSGFHMTIAQADQVAVRLKKDLIFICSQAEIDLLTELRFRLDWLFEYKLSHPGLINCDGSNNTNADLLRLLADILEYEDEHSKYSLYDASDDDDDDDD